MKIKFLGAAREVTGSCTLIEANGKKILIDCGMEQGPDTYENCEMPVSANQLDFVFLTHAHIDHSGKIPVLFKEGYDGPVYTTAATETLCEIMLADSAHIQMQEAEWRNRKAKRSGDDEYQPIYDLNDVQAAISHFVSCDYEKEYVIDENLTVKFIDAGHLLGSASIELNLTESGVTKKILFSGDIGNINRPLIRDPIKPEHADIVIMESTYGDRLHGERKDYLGFLADVIDSTVRKGGNIVVPSFAVGRTQELLYLIRIIKEKGLVKSDPDFPVYVDSPLAVEATKIYSGSLPEFYDDETLALLRKGINPLYFKNLHVSVTSDESKLINTDETPKVILSASGMCEAGRIRHHLKYNLWRPESTVLFVGYQAYGTLGRSLLEGANKVKLFGEDIQVKARIAKMDGISGHADKNMLLDWIGNLKNTPQKVFVNHGEDETAAHFAESVKEKFGFDAEAPYNGSEYDLNTLECLYKGNTEKIIKNSVQNENRPSDAYRQLEEAYRKLETVIRHNLGGANKDLNKFKKEIDALSEKWDR